MCPRGGSCKSCNLRGVDLQAVEIESIMYEDAVRSVLDMLEVQHEQRELQLVRCTAMLLEHMSTPERVASFAAMAAVMLLEERKKNERSRDVPGRRERGAGRR